jgi:hypothetical protein
MRSHVERKRWKLLAEKPITARSQPGTADDLEGLLTLPDHLS